MIRWQFFRFMLKTEPINAANHTPISSQNYCEKTQQTSLFSSNFSPFSQKSHRLFAKTGKKSRFS